ncbi:hypothetical protein EVAR_62082_1 [Eumeta japonica]|uniref:Uncharacterized protein n=1 Tax=Eumeta variegata TaxID=151549 RepID=A0A4C1Z4P6_EUMVA|nr:hypothetical protein EVAR_62082_1 [Eumeta japonica]
MPKAEANTVGREYTRQRELESILGSGDVRNRKQRFILSRDAEIISAYCLQCGRAADRAPATPRGANTYAFQTRPRICYDFSKITSRITYVRALPFLRQSHRG